MTLSYSERLLSEATLEELDNAGERNPIDVIREAGHVTLATMARQPATIAAVNAARVLVCKDRWAELNSPHAKLSDAERDAACIVWETLPGYTCLMDAVSILARL